MRRHSEEEYSIEPEVGVVIAKTTTQHIKFILTQVPIQKRQKKGPNSDLYHPFPRSFQILNKLQYIPAASYTVVPLN